MAQGDLVKFDDMRLEPAENGWILRFVEIRKSIRKERTFDENDWNHRELVFTDDQADLAFEKLKAMHMFNKMKKTGVVATAPDMSAPMTTSV